eukprot:2792868-Rhodomonas_salina.1
MAHVGGADLGKADADVARDEERKGLEEMLPCRDGELALVCRVVVQVGAAKCRQVEDVRVAWRMD